LQGNLSIGQLMAIQVDRKRYNTRIEGLTDETIYLAAPTERQLPVHIEPGTEVVISYLSKDPMRGCRWTAKAQVRGAARGRIPLLAVSRPDRWIRKQDRRFVRVPCTFEIRVVSGDVTYSGLTQDISGGGMLILLPAKVKPGSTVVLQFTLPPDEPMELAAQVVRHLSEQGKMIPTAVKFVDLDERERDRIIKFVFARQRSLRRKGLL
jgi:c-di-GMP-binding flagellar brake protein YcgR